MHITKIYRNKNPNMMNTFSQLKRRVAEPSQRLHGILASAWVSQISSANRILKSIRALRRKECSSTICTTNNHVLTFMLNSIFYKLHRCKIQIHQYKPNSSAIPQLIDRSPQTWTRNIKDIKQPQSTNAHTSTDTIWNGLMTEHVLPTLYHQNAKFGPFH